MCKYKHLPKGWKVKKLGEISNIKTGKSNAVDADINGKYAFFDRSKKIKKSNRFLFDCESLIIPGEGAQFFPRYYSGKFDLHQRVYVIFNFHNSVHIRFVEYYLIFSHKYFEEVAVGATVKSLRLRHFTEIQIPFPSLSKQKFIVVTLNKTFAKITKAEAIAKTNLQNAKELFESYLQGVLSDKRWTIVKLNNVCEKVEYGSSSKSLAVGELPVLRMGNIQDGRLAWDDLKFSNNKEDNKKYILKHNDVLFNRTNSPEWVGKTAIYKSEMPAIFAGYLIRIHRKKDLLNADYLNYYLNSQMARNYGNTVIISSVNQANINGTKLKKYPIPLPTLKKQKEIVQKLEQLQSQVKKLEIIYQQKIIDLSELKKSILQKAFNGEL